MNIGYLFGAKADHSYQGVIEGYGDGTYRGDRNITRYEMAQMIAKAMAKNPSGSNKAELDRLAAEIRQHSHRPRKNRANSYIFRFEPSAEVNEHWSVHACIDAYVHMKSD